MSKKKKMEQRVIRKDLVKREEINFVMGKVNNFLKSYSELVETNMDYDYKLCVISLLKLIFDKLNE